MKKIKLVIPAIIIMMGVYLSGCSNDDKTTSEKTSGETVAGEVVTVSLPTVQCNMCKKTIADALKGVDGVSDAKVNIADKNVKVTFDKSKTDVSKIESSITAAGYDANDKKAEKNAYDKLDDCCKKPEDQKEGGMHM